MKQEKWAAAGARMANINSTSVFLDVVMMIGARSAASMMPDDAASAVGVLVVGDGLLCFDAGEVGNGVAGWCSVRPGLR